MKAYHKTKNCRSVATHRRPATLHDYKHAHSTVAMCHTSWVLQDWSPADQIILRLIRNVLQNRSPGPKKVVLEPQTWLTCHKLRGPSRHTWLSCHTWPLAPHPPDDDQNSGIHGSTVSSAPFFYLQIL